MDFLYFFIFNGFLFQTKSFDVELRQELQMLRDVLPQLNRRVQELEQLDQSRVECESMFQQLEPVIGSINQDMQQIRINQEPVIDSISQDMQQIQINYEE